jgi:hypothetical protein
MRDELGQVFCERGGGQRVVRGVEPPRPPHHHGAAVRALPALKEAQGKGNGHPLHRTTSDTNS